MVVISSDLILSTVDGEFVLLLVVELVRAALTHASASITVTGNPVGQESFVATL